MSLQLSFSFDLYYFVAFPPYSNKLALYTVINWNQFSLWNRKHLFQFDNSGEIAIKMVSKLFDIWHFIWDFITTMFIWMLLGFMG